MGAPPHHGGCNPMTNNCLRKLSMMEQGFLSSEIDSIEEGGSDDALFKGEPLKTFLGVLLSHLAEHAEEEQAVSLFIHP
jgi:hypothetical protein